MSLVEKLGMVDSARDLARRFAERHPSQAARILGQKPIYWIPGTPRPVAKPFALPDVAEPIILPARPLSFDRTATQRAILIRRCAAAVAGVDVEDLRSPARVRRFSWPRQHAMLITRMVCDLSYPTIGDIYGGRDHTTVMTGIAHASARIQNQSAEREFYHSLCNEVDKSVGHKIDRLDLAPIASRPGAHEIIKTVAEAAGLTVDELIRPLMRVTRLEKDVAMVMVRDVWPRATLAFMSAHFRRTAHKHTSNAILRASMRRKELGFATLYAKAQAALIEAWPSLEVVPMKEAA